MIGRIVLCLALVCGAGAASAQEPPCTLYKVNTSQLIVSKDAGGNIYNDALFDGDVACVTRKANVKGVVWGYISQKLESPTVRTPVEGWSSLQNLQEITKAEADALLADTAPPARAPAARPPATAAAPAPAAPPAAAALPSPAAARAVAAVRPEDILRFDQPIPFGPFPLNGHSLKELIDTVPLFPPIEGLEESLWKKKCTSCHQWDQASLCQQAATYVQTPRYALRVPHPFGGTLQIALMRWSKSGCP